MHNNFHFFKGLVPELKNLLAESQLTACFSQSKDELILHFTHPNGRDNYIKASLTPSFSCLSFPSEFARTKKNSIDLFTQFIGKKIIDIRLFQNERAFSLQFEEGWELLFKLHGNRSNIIAIQDKKAVEIFRNNFPNDLEIDIEQLDRPLTQNEEIFREYDGNYQKVYPTLGKLVKKYLQSIDYPKMNLDKQWEVIDLLTKDLDKHDKYYIVHFEGEIYFSLLAVGEEIYSNTSAIEAITQFYYYYSKEAFIHTEKAILMKSLEKRRNQIINYIKKTEGKLSDIENKPGYNQLADIIMANLHQIPARAKSVSLYNFYTDQMIEISLKEQLSPQKNAENLYRKSKNQSIEIDQLKAALSEKRKELERVEDEIQTVTRVEDVKTLKKLLKKNKPTKNAQVEKRVPYKHFEFQGFTILVGKGARENDELTLKYAKKDDLWLHSKDVTGSHVVLKKQSNKAFSNEVVERAAQLAAFYSKRKTDSLVPVICTPKKFVRKPKGLPAGKVHVDKEETVLVSPSQWWL